MGRTVLVRSILKQIKTTISKTLFQQTYNVLRHLIQNVSQDGCTHY